MGAVLDIARNYGEFQRDVTEKQNAELVRTAQMNYDVAEQQTNAAAAEQAQSLSLEYQKARGAAQAMAAYRGVASPTAELAAEGVQASRARRNIEINAANAIAAAAAGAQVQQADPNLAQFQGTMSGLQLGGQLAEAQAAMPYETVINYETVQTGLGWQTIPVASRVQQDLDLSALLDQLDMGGVL
jgi:hypothetical protein